MGRFLKIMFALGVVGGLMVFLVITGCNGSKETPNSGSSTPLKVTLNNESGYLVKLSWGGKSDKLYTVIYSKEDEINVSGKVHSVYYGARERGFKKGDCWTVEEKGTGKKGKVCYSGKEEIKRTPPPPSPAPLTAEVTGSGVILHWPDKSTRETGYQVLRCDGGSNCRLKNYIVVAELPANTTEYHDDVTQACWRVVAVGEGGRSGFSLSLIHI